MIGKQNPTGGYLNKKIKVGVLQFDFMCYNNKGGNMFKYRILNEGKDFIFLENNRSNTKGSREKRIIIDRHNLKSGFFKYQKYNCSEACSEKLACEIAKVLNIETAQIEFAKDEKGILGIISYLFIKDGETHTDAKDFFNVNQFDRRKFCKISSIKIFLDSFGKNEFEKFIEIMVFDALIGESDRHEENWGLTKNINGYSLSPLYDSSCNLLRAFKNSEIARPYYNKEKNLEEYSNKSKTCIYKENLQGRYKHFELIEKLLEDYPQITKNKIKKLKKLTNLKIRIILNRLPCGIIEDMHKEYIYKYIIIRKKYLLNLLYRKERILIEN